jgi:hypothetical protein
VAGRGKLPDFCSMQFLANIGSIWESELMNKQAIWYSITEMMPSNLDFFIWSDLNQKRSNLL